MSKNNKKYKSKLELHDVSEILDVFGKYQIIQYSLIFFDLIFIAMIDVNYVFVAGDIDYRWIDTRYQRSWNSLFFKFKNIMTHQLQPYILCRVPECDDAESSAEFPHWWPTSTHDRCSVPVLNQFSNGTCTNTSFSDITEKCTEWIYESNNTVVGVLNLACQPWKVNLIGTIHGIGMLISTLVTGWMLDRFGRKPTIILCIVGSCTGLLKTFVTSWPVYVGIELLEACLSGGSYTATLVLMLEIVGTKKRVLAGVLYAYFNYMGECIFASIGMLVSYWKNIIYIIYCPCILFLSYTFLLNESPRWQIVTGKNENAKATMLRIAKINNINVNRDEIDNLTSIQLKEKFNIKEDDVKEKLLTAFSSKEILIRLLASSIYRFTTSFIYNGLIYNSVWLPGNKYVNFMLNTLMAFPGELIALFLLNRFGRKPFLMIGMIISSVLYVGTLYVPNSYKWTKIIIYLLSKMIIAACFTGSITYTMELYPTSTRGTLLGVGSIATRTGGILAPLTPILNAKSRVLSAICFGSMAVLSSGLLLLTPETKNLPLMDTVQQVEDSVRNAKNIKIARKVVTCADNLGYTKEDIITRL